MIDPHHHILMKQIAFFAVLDLLLLLLLHVRHHKETEPDESNRNRHTHTGMHLSFAPFDSVQHELSHTKSRYVNMRR